MEDCSTDKRLRQESGKALLPIITSDNSTSVTHRYKLKYKAQSKIAEEKQKHERNIIFMHIEHLVLYLVKPYISFAHFCTHF